MNKLLLIFLTIGLGLLAFCFWGLETAVGRAAFPEMAGLYPFYLGGCGAGIVILTASIYLGRRWRMIRRLNPTRK